MFLDDVPREGAVMFIARVDGERASDRAKRAVRGDRIDARDERWDEGDGGGADDEAVRGDVVENGIGDGGGEMDDDDED